MPSTSSAKPKTTRTRRTKAELQQEFEELVESHESSKESVNTKLDGLIKSKELGIREEVKKLTAETIIRSFSDLQLNISQTLSLLSEKIIQEFDCFSTLNKAVALEKAELAELHKIDLVLTTTDNLIEDHERQKNELESELENQRLEWEYEKEQRERENEEFNENLVKQRKRESEEYEYKKNLERKKAQDKYEEEFRLKEKQNKEKQEVLEKSWDQRESALKSQEQELHNLRRFAEEFNVKLQKEVDKSVTEAIKQLEMKSMQEFALLKANQDAEQRIAQLKVKSLEETISQQNAHIKSLQVELNDAKKQVQEIAVKAIEGASGAKALSHINQIAMEQAKGRPSQT